MRRLSPLVALIILLAVAGVVLWSSRAAEKTFFLGGIQVNEPEHETWVRTLDEVGMNTVAVTVYARQGDWDSANLWFDDEAPWVINEIRVAKAHGLKVVLVLRVALDLAESQREPTERELIADLCNQGYSLAEATRRLRA